MLFWIDEVVSIELIFGVGLSFGCSSSAYLYSDVSTRPSKRGIVE